MRAPTIRTETPKLFDGTSLLHDGEWFGVWRVGAVQSIRIVGELTDDRNPVWRAKVDELNERDGWPRFIALDVRQAIPAASLPRRMQTAAWGRRALGRIEHCTIAIGKDARVSITVAAILRIAGMSNISLRKDDELFTRDIDAMLRGERPT